MTADVYAGDEDLNLARTEAPRSVATIRVRAEADADVLFRVAAQLNLLNCPPLRFLLEQKPEGEVMIEAVVGNCTEFAVDMVCRKLERLTSVFEVECCHGFFGEAGGVIAASC
jgi:hypothetical protein